MKFSKTFEDNLERIPSDWKPFLIKYKTLKRCIKKIVLELNAKGLLQIMADKSQRIEYSFECYKPECTLEDGPVYVRPCIKVCPNCYGQTSKECLYVKKCDSSSSSPVDLPKDDNMVLTPLADYETHHIEKSLSQFSSVSCIELEADGEFFVTLLKELYQLNCLQKQNQDKFLTNLQEIQQMLIEVTSPFKKDIYTWRKIFQIYMEYKIFVGNTESDREERSWEFAQSQLNCFIDRIDNSHLVKRLKNPLSKIAYENFVKEQLTTIIPQIDDYNCPICLNIAWKPIRLCCSHVFCVRCLVKSVRKGMRNCPICRTKDAIYNTDQKVHKKQKDDDRERVAEEMEAITGLRIEERQS
ncbi:10253_t:CDS:2, partial [Gigaspora margarita]